MKNYEVTFRCDETNKTVTIKVKALGICAAIDEAIHKLINKHTHGNFYYPTKAEEVDA